MAEENFECCVAFKSLINCNKGILLSKGIKRVLTSTLLKQEVKTLIVILMDKAVISS